jgi:hypothetical protein
VSDDMAPTKGQMLAAIERERDAWESLLAEVGESRMLEPGLMGEWSFKDLIAHLNGWRARGLQRMEAAAAGQPEPPAPWPAKLETDDEINDWINEQNRDRLLGEVIDESRQSFARLAESVQRLPDEALSDPNYFAWTEGSALGTAIASGDFFGHLHEEHEPDIRRWLAK